MSLLVETTISLEDIQREALFILGENLNEAIEQVNDSKADADEAIATFYGTDYEPTIVEPVANENFVEGHRPSLISAPPDKYPNVAVMANLATPAPGTDLYDHQEVFSLALSVEIMVKSDTSEEEVNRRIQRTSEAAQLVLAAFNTLNGTVKGLGTATVELSDVFTRKERTAYGPHWFWQGARLRYTVRKEATQPSSTGSFLRAAGYNVDQT